MDVYKSKSFDPIGNLLETKQGSKYKPNEDSQDFMFYSESMQAYVTGLHGDLKEYFYIAYSHNPRRDAELNLQYSKEEIEYFEFLGLRKVSRRFILNDDEIRY